MKDFAKSIHVGNASDVIHRDGDFKIKYNDKENSYELYFNSIYYDTFHTKQQALDKIELYKKRKADRGKVGNANYSGASDQDLKNWIRMMEQDIKNYERESKKYEWHGKNEKGTYGATQYGHAIGEIKEAQENIKRMKEELERRKRAGNSKVGNADVVKDGNVWVVLYAEGTKSKEFNSEQEAKKFAAQVGNANVTPVSKPNAPIKDPKKEDKEKDKDKKPSDPKDKEGYTFKERVKQFTGNSDGTKKLFHSLKKDVEEKEEDNDEEIEEVGNAGYPMLKSKVEELSKEGKSYEEVVKELLKFGFTKADIAQYEGYIREHIGNKKVGNVKSEYEILKHDPSKMHPMYKKAYEEAMKKLAREDEEMKKRFEREYGVKAKNEASDDKFAYVMREFDEGNLKTPDGKVVTDPAQAKAIAYSESKKTENGCARARNAIKK